MWERREERKRKRKRKRKREKFWKKNDSQIQIDRQQIDRKRQRAFVGICSRKKKREITLLSKMAFVVKTIAFLMGHSVACYVRSLAPLTLLTRSAALRLAMLALLACSIHRLAHSLRSLPRGTVEIFEYVHTLLTYYTGTNAFFIFTRNTPEIR